MFPHENSFSSSIFTTSRLKRFISCDSDNSVDTVIVIGNTFILSETPVLNVFLRWIKHFKHCLAITTLSSLVFSVFEFLGPVGQVQWKHTCCRKITWNWVKFFEKISFIGKFALILEGYSMFPNENRVILRFFTTCISKRYRSCNSEKSGETVIIIRNTFIRSETHVLSALLSWIKHKHCYKQFKHCFEPWKLFPVLCFQCLDT